MSRRFRSILWHDAASALLGIGEPTLAEQGDDTRSLPHWVVLAQQRLGLNRAQRGALRLLVDDNAVKMQSLPRQLRPEEMEAMHREFRAGLAHILGPQQLAEWDLLLDELLGAVHLRNAPVLAARH